MYTSARGHSTSKNINTKQLGKIVQIMLTTQTQWYPNIGAKGVKILRVVGDLTESTGELFKIKNCGKIVD